MPQRMNDFGRVGLTRMYQTITATGDKAEGDTPATNAAGGTNILEMVGQNWKNVFIEARNEDATNTASFEAFGTRKFNDSVPDSGNAFWDVTEDHWESIEASQDDVATATNITPIEIVDKSYTYIVLNVLAAVAPTDTIARAILTTY